MRAVFYIAVGILATVGGILGNLIASAIEHTVGDFYTIQSIAGMFLGIFIVLIASYELLKRESKVVESSKEIHKLKAELEYNRQELKRLKHLHETGVQWKESHISTWQDHQRIIDKIKQTLVANKVAVDFDPIDNAPPPPLPFLQRVVSLVTYIISIFAWPFLIAITLSLVLSPAAHLAYLEYIVTPELIPTPTFITDPTSTPTLRATSQQNNMTATSASTGASETTTPETSTTINSATSTPVSAGPATRFVPKQVLWDISHYQDTERAAEDDIAFYWHDKYSSIKVALANRDMRNIISDRSVLNDDLSEFGLVIINLAWCWEQPYTEQEATKLLDYVQQGGNLIIMGDHLGTPNDNLSAITKKLGVETGGSWSIGTNEGGIEHLSVFSDHVIFEGITDIIFDYWGGELVLSNETNMVASGENSDGQVVIAALEVGEGKVVVLGDMGIWHDTEIGSDLNNEQNYLFATNVLDWMLGSSKGAN